MLSYSTYLGGSGSKSGNDIAIDSAGNAYVKGAK
ncbi:MAG: SBBP repeat-containing protein [Candidatus Magnetobacterium sp. LHC-1]